MKMRKEEMIYTGDAVFFCDTLTYDKPFISSKPRNHDSFAFVTDGILTYEKQGNIVQIKKGQVAYIAKGCGTIRCAAAFCRCLTVAVTGSYTYRRSSADMRRR